MAQETGTILDRIVADKRQELARRLREEPLSALQERLAAAPPPRPFADSLRGPAPSAGSEQALRLIAEVKKASPSKGLLCPDLDAAALARAYAAAGAAAISVLTEERHFLGSLGDMAAARRTLDTEFADGAPAILRKDFLFDVYQLHEARAYGADAVLLIVAILPPGLLTDLLAATRALGMEALVEVHDEEELSRALAAGASVVGINNRDLRTFHTDLAVTERLLPLIPGHKVIVSESGIHSRADCQRLRALGVHAVLVGEALVTAADPVAKMQELVG